MIERKIIINLITSTEFHLKLKDEWEVTLFESATAKRIASWCSDYFEKYNRAPGKSIEPLFYEKVKNGLSKDLAEEIEEDILPSLSEEYIEDTNESPDISYMVDQARLYFNERRLLKHAESITALVNLNKIIEAEAVASGYAPVKRENHTWIDLSDPIVLDKVDKAFESAGECLIKFPKAMGEFWNDQLVKGGFVAFLAPEKRGKTFLLLELAMRATKQKKRVAFFQAGDMSEGEQLKRMCIYLAKKSNKEKYCGEIIEPVADCILNQLNKCHKKERECDFGIFEGRNEQFLRREVTKADILQEMGDNPDYQPCTACSEHATHRLGAVWLKKVNVGTPLEKEEAKKMINDFFIKNGRSFKLSTHANGTLTVKQSEVIMDVWEKQEDFIPDIVIYDYPDIMEDTTKEFRHKQNEIWKALRGVSQKKNHPLVIVVTQADADSYTKNTLKLSNFSEDKRKFGHVTAMYGLNQDYAGREKELGILRINEIVVREGEFNTNHQIIVLQNLKRGRPFITSYW